MFIVDADERLSHEMENRAVLQEDSDSTNIVGRSRAAKRRCVLFVRSRHSGTWPDLPRTCHEQRGDASIEGGTLGG